MSCSLSNDSVGWLQWLQKGVATLSESQCGCALHKRMDEAISGNAGADMLVEVAAEVIAQTKACGTYDQWMGDSIAGCRIDKPHLASVLRKIPLAHDVIATTNYDVLLEKATGLRTLTYTTAGASFRMLESGASDAVIHLHGAYVPDEGIDDIVADVRQYSDLSKDEGAQFVQNLIGTAPIVFVGCGATIEDSNISRLVSFMRICLGADIPYFYLLRGGEKSPKLPEGVMPIVYGDYYADLDPFLDSLVTLKLDTVMKSLPLVGRINRGDEGASAAGLSGYHFAHDDTPFVGRGKELSQLDSFLREPSSFSWLRIVGQGGSGKSRLAYELMGRHRYEWFGFFLAENAREADAHSFKSFSDTCVAIDYVRGREEVVARTIEALYDVFAATRFRLRLIIIERDVGDGPAGWLTTIERSMGRSRSDQFIGAEYAGPIYLRDLDDKSVLSIIRSTCRRRGLPPDEQRDKQLMEAYGEKCETLAFRPLFVRMFTEAWIDNGRVKPSYVSFEGVLEAVLNREQEKWLHLFHGDQRACNSMIRLMVRAAAGGPLRLGNLPSAYVDDWETIKDFMANHSFPGKQRFALQNELVSVSCHNIDDPGQYINPQLPSIIKEFMIIYYVPVEEQAEFARELWSNSSECFSMLMLNGLSDFRENETLVAMLRAAPNAYENKGVFAAHMAYLDKRWIIGLDTFDGLLEQVSQEYAFWHDMPTREIGEKGADEYNLLKFMGLVLCAERFGAHSLEDEDLERSMACYREAATLPLGKLEGVRTWVLGNLGNMLAINGRSDLAKELHCLANEAENVAEANDELSLELRTLRKLQECNISIMECLMEGDTYAAYVKLKNARTYIDLRDEEQASLYSRSCYNVAHFSMFLHDTVRLSRAKELLDEAVEARPFDETIRSRCMMAEVDCLQEGTLAHEITPDAAREEINGILTACYTFVPTEDSCDCWAMAAIFYLNLSDDVDELDSLLRQAEVLLREDCFARSAVAQAWMLITCKRYEQSGPIPREEVTKAHAYFMRNPESEGTREAFLRLIHNSEEKGGILF